MSIHVIIEDESSRRKTTRAEPGPQKHARVRRGQARQATETARRREALAMRRMRSRTGSTRSRRARRTPFGRVKPSSVALRKEQQGTARANMLYNKFSSNGSRDKQRLCPSSPPASFLAAIKSTSPSPNLSNLHQASHLCLWSGIRLPRPSAAALLPSINIHL